MGLWLVGCVGCYVSFLMMRLMLSPLGSGSKDLWIGEGDDLDRERLLLIPSAVSQETYGLVGEIDF